MLTMMGALYEDVEKFFGDIFAYYGRFVARFPVAFIAIPMLACSLLGLGLFNLSYEYDVDKLYAPKDSQAWQDRVKLRHIFADTSQSDYYEHQQVHRGSRGTVIITYVKHDNVTLSVDVLRDTQALYDFVYNKLSTEYKGQIYSYEDVCARRAGQCVVGGLQMIHTAMAAIACKSASLSSHTDRNVTYQVRVLGGDTFIPENSSYVSTELPASPSKSKCKQLTAIRLVFNLKTNTSEQHRASIMWERTFLKEMKTYIDNHKHNASSIDIAYTVSDSLDVELYEYAGRDLRLFPITVVIMVVFATLLGNGGNWVSTHVLVALMALVGTMMAILASFGTLGLAGIPYVDICGIMPFMVIGK